MAEITANPKPSYSIDGQSISWAEYHRLLVDLIKSTGELIQLEGSPFEYSTQGVP